MLRKRNYKVYADIGLSTEAMTRRLSILDTGAGPNVIRRSDVPTSVVWQAALDLQLRGANNKPLRISGMVTLCVRLDSTPGLKSSSGSPYRDVLALTSPEADSLWPLEFEWTCIGIPKG